MKTYEYCVLMVMVIKMDHVEGIFNSMLEDVKYIKLSTYFKSIKSKYDL